MWNIPTGNQLSSIPKLYETDAVALKDKSIHLHFFLGGTDWFISEYDGDDTFFGFAILNNDHEMAEWGYISFSELKSIRTDNGIEVDCDCFWHIRPAGEVELICHAQGWEHP